MSSFLPPRPPSAAQSLFTDGLHSVFRFLSLREVALALRTCSPWLAAASKERSRKARALLTPPQLLLLSRSALCQHVCSIVLSGDPCTLDDVALLAELPALTSIQPLLLNAQSLLQAISATVEDTKPEQQQRQQPQQPVVWPQRLRALEIRIEGGEVPSDMQDAFMRARQFVIDSVARLGSITSLSLSLRTGSESGPESAAAACGALDLSPLVVGLPQLASLQISEWVASRSQLAAIRLMSSLTSLSINRGRWTAAQLMDLCDNDPPHAPHRLQNLRRLCLERTILTSEHLPALADLPALAQIAPEAWDPDALASLPALASLNHLQCMHFGLFTWVARPATVLLPHLHACARALTAIVFYPSITFTAAELGELAATLPMLESVAFDGVVLPCPGLGELRALPQLASLDLRRCTGYDLRELDGVASLRTLTMTALFAAHKSKQRLASVRLLLPQLTSLNVE